MLLRRRVVVSAPVCLLLLFGRFLLPRFPRFPPLPLSSVGRSGLVALSVGFAFRPLTENFLASIFLSIQRPFETADLVEVSGVTGYVQQLNMRTTVLMALDGNLVQIPNARVYKSDIRNFTTNANRREDFVVGIGYDDSISEAQEVALKVLADHPAVLNDPEPLVLADSLGKSTVNLRVYFWLNGREHSWLKVRSSIIRLVKRAFQKNGISMPDAAREVVCPQGVPLKSLDGKPGKTPAETTHVRGASRPSPDEPNTMSTEAEAGLSSEAGTLEKQARQAQPLKEGENLLPGAAGKASSGEEG